MKDKIIQVLKEKPVKLCVLGTVNSELKPWSAVVAYAITDEGKIIISTHKSSKKWNHIKENKNVAFLTGFTFEEPSIQAQGEATLVEEGEIFNSLAVFYFSVNPHAKKFQSSDSAFITIELKNVRITDLGVAPPKVEEVIF